MTELSLDECKRIEFEILKHFDAFCRKNTINYSLAYGTLIGAIRHQGFIPWDDDIDIMMSRNDYERFVHLYENTDKYLLKTSKKGDKWWPLFSKLTDRETEVFFPGSNSSPHGLWLAIIPVDNVPDDETEWNVLKNKMKKALNWYRKTTSWFSKSSDTTKSIIKRLLRTLFPSPYYWARKVENIRIRANNKKSKMVGQWVEKERHIIFPSYFMESYIDVSFEGLKCMAIREYDNYLTQVYGNYMKFPPKEQQVPLHGFKAYIK